MKTLMSNERSTAEPCAKSPQLRILYMVPKVPRPRRGMGTSQINLFNSTCFIQCLGSGNTPGVIRQRIRAPDINLGAYSSASHPTDPKP